MKCETSSFYGGEFEDHSHLGCSLVEVDKRFKNSRFGFLDSKGFWSPKEVSSSLPIEVYYVKFPETSINFKETKRRCIPKVCHLQTLEIILFYVSIVLSWRSLGL
jgi:hypothetical protein